MYTGPITGPPRWPAREYMAALADTQLLTTRGGRQEVCRYNPLIFGLVYFPHLMIRGDVIHMNDVHTDLARWGGTWAKPVTEPGENRHAWIAPRGSAKSTWMLNILPLWACAFGHRRFIAMFGITEKAITATHMKNLINAIRSNDLLRFDYPTFCSPKPGTTATRAEYQSDNGTKIVAAGVNEGYLGMNRDGARPDTILLDDMDDAEGKHSAGTTASRLATIRQGIFGMNPRAIVGWAGTVPARGSLCDDLVRDAIGEVTVDWVRETKFQTHYYPAIMTDPDGSQRSLWPVEWDLDWMLSQRGIRDFELNFMNRPPSNASGTFWSQQHFVYGIPSSWLFSDYAMWIDPAVTNNTSSDFTGIAIAGYAEHIQKVGVLMSGNIKVTPEGLKRQVHGALSRFYPLGLRKISVEKNQGGLYLKSALAGLDREFPGLKIELPHSDRGKAVEFAEAFTHYERGRVRHSQQFRVAESQMMLFPDPSQHDDCGEAIVRVVNKLLAHLPTLAAA
jgi:hypothetical protein